MRSSIFRPGVMRRARRPQMPDRGFKAEVIDTMTPQGPMGWALEVGPDLLGSTAAGVYGYQNLGGAGGAAAAAGEDLVLGLVGSGGGRFAGGALMRLAAQASGASPSQMRAMIAQGQSMGGLVGGMGAAYFGPRPFTDAMRQQQEEEYLRQEALQGHWALTAAAGNPIAQNIDALVAGGWA